MSTITLNISDDLAQRLQPYSEYIPTILELGLYQFVPNPAQMFHPDRYAELDMVVKFLQNSPLPEEVIALRLSKGLQAYLQELLEKNRGEGLTEAENKWWERFEQVEHLVRLAKAKAFAELHR
jgi:hypothetical protein